MSKRMVLPVSFKVDGEVGLIIVDHPPVNALSHAVRTGLLASLQKARDHPAVHAIVVLCNGRTFIAGADIVEFGKPPQPPYLPEVVKAIEDSGKPIVAAIHGSALGGGFEIALACHYRIAAGDAKVGMPEVKLGLMPAAGGTQRLPRLVGAVEALRWIATGDSIDAQQAHALGAIDEIVVDANAGRGENDGPLHRAAVAAARWLSAKARAPRRTGQLALPDVDRAVLADIERDVRDKAHALLAPRYCIEAIRAACTLPFVEGLQRERELFLELAALPQAAALRHVFLGEREAAKRRGLTSSDAARGLIGAAVAVGDDTRSVADRMLARWRREACIMIDAGATSQHIVRVLIEFGVAPGSSALADIADPERGDIHGAAIVRSAIDDEEILERFLYSIVNEGAKILGEQIAMQPVDIDMIWLHGYGFPAWRGGPMFCADQVGLANVRAAIQRLCEHLQSEQWTPAPLLSRLVAQRMSFYPEARLRPTIIC